MATSQYFGVVGNGQLHVLETEQVSSKGGGGGVRLKQVAAFLSPEGLYDCSWNEANQNQLVTASADGSVCLWDVGASDGFPVRRWPAHAAEAASVDWNFIEKTTFLSASWDGTVKLWQPEHAGSCLASFDGHGQTDQGAVAVYNAIWSPHAPSAFASAGADGTLRLWDVRQGGRSRSETVLIAAHADEVLALDFDKYAEHVVVSGSVDRSVRLWDLRFPAHATPLSVLVGHAFAVKRLKCHPHVPGVLGSVSYDMTACLWDATPPPALATRAAFAGSQTPVAGSPRPPQAEGLEGVQAADYGARGVGGGQIIARGDHSEFACGIDFSLFNPDRVATCGWDRRVYLWDAPLGHLSLQ